ncbi:peptidyl-tRNA hydrolase [Candidatus Magnetomoraceae bacterium gMMP-15]
MSVDKLYLIAGLGNPGKAYETTRHNLGFMVVDRLSKKRNIIFDKTKFSSRFGRGNLNNIPVILAKPMNFMNLSGPPLQGLARFFKIKLKNILVIHDDMDIAFGKIKIKKKGGHGGHNGVRSIMNAFGNGDFVRLRIGIGHPDSVSNMTDHVLGSFNAQEKNLLDKIVNTSCDAIKTILLNGVSKSMNCFNNKKILV